MLLKLIVQFIMEIYCVIICVTNYECNHKSYGYQNIKNNEIKKKLKKAQELHPTLTTINCLI